MATTDSSHGTVEAHERASLDIALWVAQSMLGLFFVMAGTSRALSPIADAIRTAPWAADVAPWFVRFIGVAELAGGVGVVLPALTRVQPLLTPFAALGLMTIMLLALPFHMMRRDALQIGMHLVFAGLAAAVAWGRFRWVRITPRW